ncbi:MAG: GreA/GreB family elongation factor [Polyangiaceae bacterium]|nr:GreA/GreB family elongation factor [Polyangiaceae bacterium]
MIAKIDKIALWEALKLKLEEELGIMEKAQKQSQEGATHEEGRAEGDKDMRATEVSYLARGQALRVVELTEGLTKLSVVRPRAFRPSDPLAMGAIVQLEDQDSGEQSTFLLAPAGAGARLQVSVGPGERMLELVVLTASSPLGRSLLGQHVGDEVELSVPAKKRSYVVVEVA